MLTRNLKNLFQTIFIFICLLYGLIPFETSNYITTFRIHSVFLILLIIYAWYKNNFKLSQYSLIFIMFFSFLIGVLLLISYGEGAQPFLMSIFLAAILVPSIYNNDDFKDLFLSAIKWLIIVSIGMLFLQFFMYLLTGELLLLHEFVFPFSKARIAVEIQYNDLTRMGGMYIEPGTYSNYMFILLSIYMLLRKKIDYLLLFISAVSIIMSASVWGMIFGTYILVIITLAKLKSISWNSKILLFIAVFLIGYFSIVQLMDSAAISYATHKLESNQKGGSTGNKKAAYRKYAETYDEFFVFGQGISPKFKKGIGGIQDAGLLLNLSIVFGILFTVIMMSIYVVLLVKVTNYTIALISLPIFMSKIFYWDPGFWFLFFMIVYSYLREKKISKL